MSPPSDQDNRPRWAPAAAPVTTMEAVLAADWVAPSIARDRVRRWLTTQWWSRAQLEDLVLAISEAVSNSVEHGYGILADDPTHLDLTVPSGVVEVRGQILIGPDGARRVEFTIRDHGRWIPPATICGSRGHGMTIMRACTEEVTVDPAPDGTTVVLLSHPVPRIPLRLA